MLAVAGSLLCAGTATAAVADDIARCAAIAAAEARLACYDALAARRTTGAAPRAPAVAPSAAAPSSAASSPAPAAITMPSAPGRADSFGLNPAQLHREPAGPAAIQAIVSALTATRDGRTILGLDNGQTWVIDEPDVRVAVGDEVTIKRAALGSFLLLGPSRHSYRVRRAQ